VKTISLNVHSLNLKNVCEINSDVRLCGAATERRYLRLRTRLQYWKSLGNCHWRCCSLPFLFV